MGLCQRLDFNCLNSAVRREMIIFKEVEATCGDFLNYKTVEQRLKTLSEKGQIVNILGFMSRMVFVATISTLQCKNRMSSNRIPIKLYSNKEAVSRLSLQAIVY